ncbi:chemotaxis protein CheW [Vibrio profundi]|uniref:chemotaxis protein CheW n=1 Tax=Vibrio profundi TaxID=1774960 RepID=UPI003735D680
MDKSTEMTGSETLEAGGCLLVEIGGESFGISITSVKEVIELEHVTQVPMCSETISGVINVRGSVVPVLDAAKRLGLASETQYDKYSCIVLYDSFDVTTEEMVTIGVLVKRVRAIEELQIDNLAEAPYFGAHIPVNFIQNMARTNNRMFVVLDMSALLNVNSINDEIVNFQKSLFKSLLG